MPRLWRGARPQRRYTSATRPRHARRTRSRLAGDVATPGSGAYYRQILVGSVAAWFGCYLLLYLIVRFVERGSIDSASRLLPSARDRARGHTRSHEITRDRTRSPKIGRDRTRSQQAHTGFTGWHLKPTKTVLLLRLKSRRRSALPS